MPEVNDRREMLEAFADRDGIYEYQALNGDVYFKLTGSVFDESKWRLTVGIATSDNYGGPIGHRPIEHAGRVRNNDLEDVVQGFIDLLNSEADEVKEVKDRDFDLDGIHSRYHDRRRAYFQATLREPYNS